MKETTWDEIIAAARATSREINATTERLIEIEKAMNEQFADLRSLRGAVAGGMDLRVLAEARRQEEAFTCSCCS